MRILFLILFLMPALSLGAPRSNPVVKALDRGLKSRIQECRDALNNIEIRERIHENFLDMAKGARSWFEKASDWQIIQSAQSLQDPVLKQLTATGRKNIEELIEHRLSVVPPSKHREKAEIYVAYPIENLFHLDMFERMANGGDWDGVISTYPTLADHWRDYPVNRQRVALAYRKRNQPGDFEKSKKILLRLIQDKGPDSETYGLLGSLYKQLYLDQKASGAAEKVWKRTLDKSIDYYLEGVRTNPYDFYPATAVISLLYTKGTPKALEKVKNLANLLNFVMTGKLGPADKGSKRKPKINSNETPYWRASTLLRLEILAENWENVEQSLAKVHGLAEGAWNLKSTRDDYNVLLDAWLPLNKKGLISDGSIIRLAALIQQLNQAIEQMDLGEARQ